jgi:hypothetical protein
MDSEQEREPSNIVRKDPAQYCPLTQTRCATFLRMSSVLRRLTAFPQQPTAVFLLLSAGEAALTRRASDQCANSQRFLFLAC